MKATIPLDTEALDRALAGRSLDTLDHAVERAVQRARARGCATPFALDRIAGALGVHACEIAPEWFGTDGTEQHGNGGRRKDTDE